MKTVKVTKNGRKKRIAIQLTKYPENGKVVKLSRLVPARMHDLIKQSDGKMSIKVTYKKGVSNESLISDDKKYILNTLSAFTAKSLIQDALEGDYCKGIYNER